MAALRAQGILLKASPAAASSLCDRRIRASLRHPAQVRLPGISLPSPSKKMLIEEYILRDATVPTTTSCPEQERPSTPGVRRDEDRHLVVSKLYAVMEAAADRARMHGAIGEQRNNWNTLLLGSINSMTLAAALAAGVSAAMPTGGVHLAFKASSVLLYSAATAMSLVVNKIQPSQLVEEQRNAARLFGQLEGKIRSGLAAGHRPTAADVEDALARVLALDKAYPLSLLPGMLEKFPEAVEPTVWWPELRRRRRGDAARAAGGREQKKGWGEDLRSVMTGVLRVLKKNDTAEYVKLGKLVLGINTVLASAGPLLTGLAAAGASLLDAGSPGAWPVLLGVVGGSLATVVNTLEHGGQVGMVFELYRNCAGFYRQLEEEIEVGLEEADAGGMADGELFELTVALQLGRSLPEMRALACHASSGEEDDIDEYAGKLF